MDEAGEAGVEIPASLRFPTSRVRLNCLIIKGSGFGGVPQLLSLT